MHTSEMKFPKDLIFSEEKINAHMNLTPDDLPTIQVDKDGMILSNHEAVIACGRLQISEIPVEIIEDQNTDNDEDEDEDEF